MNPIPLTVMLHGLIALAPASNAGHMTALLLDERMASTESCMAMHSPKLTFSVPDVTIDCLNAGCSLSELVCTCTDALSRKKIWLDISSGANLGALLPQSKPFLPKLPKTSDKEAGLPQVPTTSSEATEISYIANLSLSPFGQTLNEAYTEASPPQNLFARMDVPFGSVTPCALATRQDQGDAYTQPFGFYPLHGLGDSGGASQAVAQIAVATLPLTAGQTVTLHISSFDDTSDRAVAIDPAGIVQLSNDTPVLDPDDACEDGVARHFAMYYELAMNPPPMGERLIPHARYTNGVKVEAALIPEICQDAMAFLDPMDRPVCPIAIFKP